MTTAEVVLDASVVVIATSVKTSWAASVRSRLPQVRSHAPHLIDAEVGSALRRLEQAGELSAQEATTALWAAGNLVDVRHRHDRGLSRVAWELRSNVTFYDALYVALASRLGATLLTADARLARSPGLPCAVEVI